MSARSNQPKTQDKYGRDFIVRWRPFSEGLILIGIWEGERELAYVTAPPIFWDDEVQLEKLLRCLVNEGMI